MKKKEKENLKLGCSSMKLTSKTNNNYWFRTCDMDDTSNIWKAGSKVVSFKKGYEFKFSNNEKINSKYSILGISYGNPYERLLDGVNENGLVGGLLYYVEGTSIDNKDKSINENNKIGVEGMEILTYILSQCKNVKEVIELASKIIVTNIIYGEYKIPATMHYTFLDNNGDSVILEADINGRFTIYEKTIGVFTNSPSYNEHLKNLSWFIASSLELNQGRVKEYSKKLTPPINKFELDNVIIEGNIESKTYMRSNVFPGSYISSDRFIRLATLKHLANCGRDFEDEEILLKGNELMSSVIVPRHKGYFYYNYLLEDIKQNVNYKDHSLTGKILFGGDDDYTQYIVMYDLNNKLLYIKSDKSLVYDCFNLNSIKEGLTVYEINNDTTKGIVKHFD